MSATLHPKLFLQAVLAHPSLSHKHCLGLFKATAQAAHDFDPDLPPPPPADELETRWNDFRHRLNTQLEVLGLQLTQVTDEGDKGRWVVLVNTESDDLAQLATVYTPLELTYLKLLIKAIVLAPSYTYSISRLNASRLVGRLPNQHALTRAGAENLVERFVSGGWVDVSKTKKRLSLSIRTLTELEGYLESEFAAADDEDEDDADELDEGRRIKLLKCCACKTLVTKGKLCPSCPLGQTAIHNHCLHKLLLRASASSRRANSSQSQPKKGVVHCPKEGDGVNWVEEGVEGGEVWVEVGERALDGDGGVEDELGFEDDEAEPRGKALSGKEKRGERKSGGKRKGGDSGEEESEAQESGAEDGEGQSSPVRRSSTASQSKKRRTDVSDDSDNDDDDSDA